jgi:protein phosphatase PTC1
MSGCTAVTALLRIEDVDGKQGALPSAGSPTNLGQDALGSQLHTKSVDALSLGQSQGKSRLRRVLYTANVGDARAVLCRNGLAIRLTYDHKASDPQEAKRIKDAGGFLSKGRVSAHLNVTRSLGDAWMKQYVEGVPYTTETTLGSQDEFLVLASDGVSRLSCSFLRSATD